MIGVVAHVNREHLVEELLRDTQVDVIKWDDGLPSVKGCADNHIRVLTELERHAPLGDWVVVLEDDSRPVADFRNQLKHALAQAQTPLVGLYLGGGNLNGPTQRAIAPAVQAAQDADSNWIVADWFIASVGYAVRSTWLSAMITDLSGMGGPFDMRINRWSQAMRIQTWYTQPSLVDHRDEPSVIAPGVYIPPRRAYRCGGRERWGVSVTHMGHAEPWGPEYAHC